MKKGLLLILALIVFVSVIFAEDYMLPGPQMNLTAVREKEKSIQPTRTDTLIVTFSVNPLNLLLSYYDYMIGGYNDLPMSVQPDPTYGGYFLTFHGKRTATGQRRAFYSYISDNGVIENMNELTNVQNWEGYPSIGVDPLSGKPIYAWHVDADTDAEYEVQLAWDAFLFGAAGLISDPVIVVNNPSTLPAPYNTTNNEYIWPTVQIGPSPTAGMRRVYVLARNAVTHTTYPSENVKIAYADFNADMLEMGTALTWSYTSIPTLDAWNHDTVIHRRPNFAFTVGNDGRIYYVGYHTATVLSPEADLYEPDLDAFVCDNYGQGTWQRYTAVSRYNSWNPHDNYGSGTGIFTVGDVPVPDDSVFWEIYNSAHTNAVMDELHGKVHLSALWANLYRGTENGEISTYWHPTMQIVKDLVYDVNTQAFEIRELYPVAGTPTDNITWLPWDNDGDGLVDEFYTNPDDPNDPDNGYPLSSSTYPFPYWDDAVHTDAMFFHYSNTKITPPNAQGMMAAVWQDSNRARLYNELGNLDYAAFADVPEIYISCSPDYGMTWSEPVTLNKVETPELAGMKPMWVYPADQVKYVTTENGRKIGKLAVMFFDDISWGAYAIDGPVGQNDGGYVRFMELNIAFPPSVSNDDQANTPAVTMLKQNYPNPFNPETTISFTMPKNGTANLSIYNTKGQLVKTLVNGNLASGEHKLTWKGTDNNNNSVSSGLYFYKLNANGSLETRKMMLMK